MGDGSPVREFLHVDYFASAIKHIIINELFSEPVLNVSGDTSWTISDLAAIIKGVTRFQGHIVHCGLIKSTSSHKKHEPHTEKKNSPTQTLAQSYY